MAVFKKKGKGGEEESYAGGYRGGSWGCLVVEAGTVGGGSA